MKGITDKIFKGVAGVFVKKVMLIDNEGEEITKTKARQGVKGVGWIVGFLLLWHFILQPLLSHFFPGCEFPALDCGWLGTLLMGL